MTTATDAEALVRALAAATPALDAHHQRIALGVYRSLAAGAPAEPAAVARREGVRPEVVDAALAAWPGVYFDAEGRVVGFWGLTVQRMSPTYRLETGGRELFAWCAWDTLFLPELLGTTVQVEAVCPDTADIIRLQVSPQGVLEASHPGAAVSFLVPEREFGADVIQSFCHFVFMFASSDAGDRWAQRHPGTFVLSLQDAFDVGRAVNEARFPAVLGR